MLDSAAAAELLGASLNCRLNHHTYGDPSVQDLNVMHLHVHDNHDHDHVNITLCIHPDEGADNALQLRIHLRVP